MEKFLDEITTIYDEPIYKKIMLFMILKNLTLGIFRGFIDFNSSERPVTQIFTNIVRYGCYGYVEAMFWPITFPYLVINGLDNLANYVKKKN